MILKWEAKEEAGYPGATNELLRGFPEGEDGKQPTETSK
jgi:hypothetical protein